MDEPIPPLRLMCYNIAAGNGDIDAIADVIRAFDPDIVALQEVDVHWGSRSEFIDQAEYLAASLEMHVFFGEIYAFESLVEGIPLRRYGLAWLSKTEFQNTDNHYLSRLSTQTDPPELMTLPGFPEVSIDWHGQSVFLFNTHLDYRPDPTVRSKQIDEMLGLMAQRDGAIILAGDLNARPNAPELSPLFEVLQDAWIHDDPGYTFPSHQPDRRIDYILHNDRIRVRDIQVPATLASDHLPVVADLYIRSN